MKMKDRKRTTLDGFECIQVSDKEFASLPLQSIKLLIEIETHAPNEHYVNLAYFVKHPELFDLEDMPNVRS